MPRLVNTAARSRISGSTIIRLAKNGGISANTNIGLAEAKGEYLALLDHDDLLQLSALYEMACAINQTGAEMLYSDEIVLNDNLKQVRGYHFKRIFHRIRCVAATILRIFWCFPRQLMENANIREDSRYNGAQDYDLILRLSGKYDKIFHIPKVLYYWRSHKMSTASDISTKP